MFLKIGAICSLLGILDALYLLLFYVGKAENFACPLNGCEQARSSMLAHIGSVPTPLVGIVGFAMIYVVLQASCSVSPVGTLRAKLQDLTICLAAAGVAFSLALTLYEVLVLKAVCLWCALCLLLITCVFFTLKLGFAVNSPEPSPRWFTGATLGLVVASFCLTLQQDGGSPLVTAQTSSAAPTAAGQILVRANSRAIGPLDAPVTIVEFADFRCAACADSYPKMLEIVKRYKGKVRFVLRNMPAKGPQSFDAAVSAELASSDAEYFQRAESLFSHRKSPWAPSNKKASAAASERVRQDLKDGRSLHLRYLPTIFIGAQRLEGRPDKKALQALIESKLQPQLSEVSDERTTL